MNVYLARQPIYSIDKTPAAFELLYRDSDKNVYNTELDGNQSTRAVITQSLFMFDLEKLTQNKPAFVNFTRDLILEKVPMLLNSNNFTIEILEDIELDELLIERLTELKQAGFTLALDDYTGVGIPDKALSLIDIIKVDFLLTPRDMRKKIARTFLPKKKILLAEKVENREDFDDAARNGYELFQGYYFSKPIMLKSKRKDISREDKDFFNILESLKVSDILQGALQGDNQLGVILDLAELYETGNWRQLKAVLDEHFPESGYQNLAAMYIAAVNYADSVLTSE